MGVFVMVLSIYAFLPILFWIVDGAQVRALRRWRGTLALWYSPFLILAYFVLTF